MGNNTWIAIEKAIAMVFTIKDYFPVKENTKYTYEGKGNEYSSYYVLVDYIISNIVQLRHVDKLK